MPVTSSSLLPRAAGGECASGSGDGGAPPPVGRGWRGRLAGALWLPLFGLLGFAGRAQAVRVVQTDSSRIETRLYPGGREEREILRRPNRVRWRFYQGNGAQVTTTATFTKDDRAIGLWTEYDARGKVRYVIDCDRGSWRVAQAQAYPFFARQQRMKARADSLLAATYGWQFLRQQAVWNVQNSYIYNARESGNWTDQLSAPPTRFLFRYTVRLDARHVYPDLIEFELDAQGRFLPNSSEQVFGFERRPPGVANGFALRYEAALQLVERLSGARRQSLAGSLHWESWRQASFYNGHFRFYVPVPTGTSQELHPAGRSQVIAHFDVFVFDPWTGVLLGRKKMKTVRGWEAHSGSSSGLLPE